MKSAQHANCRFFSRLVTTSKNLHGLAGRRYGATIGAAPAAFGAARSTVSKHIVEATAKKLQEFKERDLSGFVPFAILLDTIHRGGSAFVVALWIDVDGEKCPFGFWERGSGIYLERYEIVQCNQ